MIARTATVWALAAGTALAGCGDKLEAHLERFLDTRDGQPAPAVSTLDAFALADNPEAADRIQTMNFTEVAQRLGPHRCTATVWFEFAGSDTRASLRESSSILLAQNGDFRVKVENDVGQGYELVYSGQRLYLRSRYGPFHEQSTLASDHLKWRDMAYGSWAAIYRLYRGRLSFGKLGLARHHGRDALQFSIGLSPGKPRLPGTPDPPAVPGDVIQYVYPIEPAPSDRDRWRDQAQPKQGSGTLLVDTDTGVILRADLKGVLSLPAAEGEGSPIILSVSATMQLDGFGNPPSIAPPGKDEIVPIPELIPVDTHPLDFYFGKGFTSSLGKPAGVAARPQEDDAEQNAAGGSSSKP